MTERPKCWPKSAIFMTVAVVVKEYLYGAIKTENAVHLVLVVVVVAVGVALERYQDWHPISSTQ